MIEPRRVKNLTTGTFVEAKGRGRAGQVVLTVIGVLVFFIIAYIFLSWFADVAGIMNP